MRQRERERAREQQGAAGGGWGARTDGRDAFMFWEEHIETRLAGGEALLQLLPYFCKIESDDGRGSKCDPITNTIITLLSSPLHLCRPSPSPM